MKYEWFPFSPSKYRADTMHLTAEQDGIYFRLIMHYMETELPLPDNDLALARIAGVPADCFGSSSATLRAFFKQENGKLHHKKCDEVLSEMNRRYEMNREKGKRGGEARAKNIQEKQHPATSATEQVKPDSSQLVPPYLTLPNPTKKKKVKSVSKFEEFWKVCPKKVGKGDAERKYLKALEEVSHETLVSKMRAHRGAMEGTESQFIPNPATWIYQKRYFDETAASKIDAKEDWPKWKNALAARIGDHNMKGWFNGVEMNGQAFYAPLRFQVEKIKTEFMTDIEAVFGKPYEIKLRGQPTPTNEE